MTLFKTERMVATNLPRHIIFIGGAYGVGKTTFISSLKEEYGDRLGYVEEGVLEVPRFVFRSQHLITAMELMVAQVKEIERLLAEGKRVVVCDSGPVEHVVYRKGAMSFDYARTILEDMSERFEFPRLEYFLLDIPTEERWERVVARVEKDPRRAAFREADRMHFDYVEELFSSPIVRRIGNLMDVSMARQYIDAQILTSGV